MRKIRKKIGAILYTCPSGFQYDRWRTLRINQFIDRCGDDSPIVEIGSQERIPRKNIINLDVRFSPNVDVIADGCYLPFKKQSLSGVSARGVLEHISTPRLVIEEIHRSLKNKGTVYLEVPFIQGFHADPGDYQRYTLDGLEFLCNSFAKIESGVCGGPSSATAWILQEFLTQLFSFSNNRLKVLMSFLFGWMCFPLRYLDFFMYKNPSAGIISSGVYFWGEKSNESGEVSIKRVS